MQKYQIGSTEWIKQELAGLLGEQVTRDIEDSIRLYAIYDGDGQLWKPDTSGLDYKPTVKVTNIVKKLIKEEARFMMGVEPEIKIQPMNGENEADRAACAEIEDWLSDFLRRSKWGDKLIKAARDCFIGKRVALKLTGAPGRSLGVQFRPSLEFVYDTDPEDVDKLAKVVFFYHTNESMGGLSSGITDAQETLTTDAQTAAQGAQTAAADCLTLDIGKEDGTAYMAGVSSGFNGARSALAADAKTVAGEAASAARTALAYSVGQGIGQNMVYGMAAGVRSGASAMYSTITSVANAAVRRAKSALRINSPSGVFADEVGAWIPGGIGVGVTKNMDDALGPLDEVRRSMVGLFDGALSGVTLGDPQIPWSPQGSGGGPTTVNININGDWTVRSDEDRDAILSELYERISDETRRR